MPSFVLLFPSGPHKMEQKQSHDFSLCNARMIIAGLFATSYDSVCTVGNARMSEWRPFWCGSWIPGLWSDWQR